MCDILFRAVEADVGQFLVDVAASMAGRAYQTPAPWLGELRGREQAKEAANAGVGHFPFSMFYK